MLLQVWHSCKARGTPGCLWLLLKLSLSVFWRQHCTGQGRMCRASGARESQAHLPCEATSKHFEQGLCMNHSPQHLCRSWRQTGLPNKPLLPPCFLFWISYLWQPQKSPVSPPWENTENVCSTVWESCRWGLMKGIYRIDTHTPTGWKASGFCPSGSLKMPCDWVQPTAAAPLFSLTPTRHKVSQGCSGHVCKPDKPLEFLFYGAECLWYREDWSIRQRILNTFWQCVLSSSGMNNSHNAGYCQMLVL